MNNINVPFNDLNLQYISIKEEIDTAISEVIKSSSFIRGPFVEKFEHEFSQEVGVKHCVSCANGTDALYIAIKSFNIQPGDEIIVPANSWISSSSAITQAGAKVVFCDVNPLTNNIEPNEIKRKITSRTVGIIAVHLFGHPADMGAICAIANENKLWVIEDCAQAHGAKIDGQLAGSFGDCAAFSFCQDKIMSTGGEGGMLLVDDDLMWERAWSYKDHGKSLKKIKETADTSGFKWLHQSFGSNWRMTEIQAAIGRIQLGKLNDWVDERRKNAQYLYRGLSSVVGLNIPLPPEHVKHAYYRFYVFLEREKLSEGWDQLRILERIFSFGVPCFVGSCGEIYKEEAFGLFPDIHERQLEVSNYLSEISLAFLVHPGLPLDALDLTVETVKNVMLEATS